MPVLAMCSEARDSGNGVLIKKPRFHVLTNCWLAYNTGSCYKHAAGYHRDRDRILLDVDIQEHGLSFKRMPYCGLFGMCPESLSFSFSSSS